MGGIFDFLFEDLREKLLPETKAVLDYAVQQILSIFSQDDIELWYFIISHIFLPFALVAQAGNV